MLMCCTGEGYTSNGIGRGRSLHANSDSSSKGKFHVMPLNYNCLQKFLRGYSLYAPDYLLGPLDCLTALHSDWTAHQLMFYTDSFFLFARWSAIS